MLTDRFGSLDLGRALKYGKDFSLFSKSGDREGWARVLPATMKVWLDAAEQYKDYEWPALPAGLCLHFQRTGENLPSLHRMWERRSALGILAVAECIEGAGRYVDQIISGIYSICEETVWMTPFDLGPFHEVLPAPEHRIVNLATSETGALLAWVHYLFRDQLDRISPRICDRIRREITERLIEPYHAHDDYWWMGFAPTHRVNNWNPWCNRNILMCLLLIDMDDDMRFACLRKLMRSLDAYLSKYPPDGCCDEGPMYWGAAGGGLHTCLKLLHHASGGTIDIFDMPIVRDIGAFIYKAHIHGEWSVDFADGDAHVRHGSSVYHYGKSIGDEAMVRLGASAEPQGPAVLNWFAMFEYLQDIFSEEEMRNSRLAAPYTRDGWMWHTKMMFAREREGTPAGLYLAAKAGHNAEAHNHNDTGNFIVYADGNPVLIDLGTEEYTAKTFSPQRFELWYLQSQYHNCPTVRGVLQHEGEEFTASNVEYESDDRHAELRADIGGAYPASAGISSWIRSMRLNRSDGPSVEIVDDYTLDAPTADVMWSLMTPLKPVETAPGRLELEYAPGKRAAILFDGEHLSCAVEAIDFMESRLRRNWGDMMYRIVLKEKSEQTQAVRKVTVILTPPVTPVGA